MPAQPSSQGNNGGRLYSYASRPVLIDCNFVVASTDSGGLGITGLKGQGVEDVFMYTTQTAGRGNSGLTNPLGQTASKGIILVKLANNYKKLLTSMASIQSPVTGAGIAVNGSALTVGVPYSILTVGHGTLGAATIATVADSAGSLASTYFVLYDNYGNTWAIWFSVSGVGVKPSLGTAAADGAVGLHYVQQSITTGDSAATIGAALAVTIAALPSGVSGVFSFTAAGTTTVTATSTQTNPYSPLPGPPVDGTVPTGFTLATTVKNDNTNCWTRVGLLPGVTPAVGAPFVATATGFSTNGASTGTVKALGVSGLSTIELIGDTNKAIGPIPTGRSSNTGGYILLQTLSPVVVVAAGTSGDAVTNNAGVLNSTGGQDLATTMTVTQPADASTIQMSFYVNL